MFVLIIAVILEWSRSDGSNLNADSFTVTEPAKIWKRSSLTNGLDCSGSRERNIGQNGKEVRRSSKHSRHISHEVQRHYRVPNRRSSAQTTSFKSEKLRRFAQETSKDAIYCQKRARLKKDLRKDEGHICFRYKLSGFFDIYCFKHLPNIFITILIVLIPIIYCME